jgi:hypothetical protein
MFSFMKRNNCRRCGFELKLQTVPECSGADIQVITTFLDLPILMCPKGCTKKHPYPNFGPDLIEVVNNTVVPRLDEYFELSDIGSWVATRPPRCSYCDSVGVAFERESWSKEAEIALEKTAPFRLLVELPIFTCHECGMVQAIDDPELVYSSIAEAMATALLDAGIKP